MKRMLRRILAAFVPVLAVGAGITARPANAASPPSIGQDPLAEHYELGHGLHLGETGFTLGGYGELSFKDLDRDQPTSLAVDHLSGFLWWDNGARLHFFTEADLEKPFQLAHGHSTTDDAHVVSERLYFDYSWLDTFKVRLGKFLTPVGRWNLNHAAPLTWTTSRPLITEATFPTNATGLMIYGTIPWLPDGIEYSIYGSTGDEIFRNHEVDTFKEAVGGRLSATVAPHLQVGVSYASFEQESDSDVRKELRGADFAWTWQRWQLSGEYDFRTLKHNHDSQDEQGLYVQLVAPLSERWYAVGRYERFYPQDADEPLNLYLAGAAFRPMPAVIIKGEYSVATENGPQVPAGFRASIAVLF